MWTLPSPGRAGGERGAQPGNGARRARRKADLLVTGDADLLALARPGLRPRLRFRIITVPQLLEHLRAPPLSSRAVRPA